MGGWEVLGRVEVDSATCAFADAATIPPGFSLRDSVRADGSLPDASLAGIDLVLCDTRADLALPVEVRRDDAAEVVMARLAFVDDVDELEGEWQSVGVLRLDSGCCVACDPYRYSSDDCYHLEFPVRAGEWLAKTFAWDRDQLCLRISRAERPS